MSVQVEKLEHNMAKLTIEVEASKFDAAMKKAYNKKKGSFNLPGFRKGKVPMYIIEKEYGAGVFYEDAANELMPEAYAAALEESGLEVVSRPEVDVTQIGKGQNFIFTAEVAVKPEVKLGEYKGLDVQMDSVEVADEEVEAKLKEAQEQNAREITVEDRAVQDGDIITLNYAGTVDGELQQQSIDEVNSYVSNAVGNRKLSNSEVETAIQVAMQNVAAGANPADELKTVQDVQDAQ